MSADDRLIDLGRGEVDVAVRYLADASAPEGAVRLFGERMMPVASPKLVRRRGTPLGSPADLSRHVLLHLDDPDGRDAVARLDDVAHGQRATGLEARRVAALQALRPGDPGRGRRPGRGARPHSADRRASARRTAHRSVPEALRLGTRLLCGRRAACRRRATDVAASCRWLRRAKAGARAAMRRRRRADHARRASLRPGSCASRRSSRRGRAYSISRAGTGRHARYFAARGANVVAVDRDAGALAALARRGATSKRASLDLESGAVAARRRALRRDRRHQLPASAAVSGASARAGGRRRAALRDLRRAATKRTAGRPIRISCSSATSSCGGARGRLTVIAFEQGLVSARAPSAVVQRLAAAGLARVAAGLAAALSRAELPGARREQDEHVGLALLEWGKINAFRGFLCDSTGFLMLTGSLVAIVTPMRQGRRARSRRAAASSSTFTSPTARRASSSSARRANRRPSTSTSTACSSRPRSSHARGRIPVIAGHRRELDRRGDRAHRVREGSRRATARCRSFRTTTSRRRKACIGTFATIAEKVDLPLILYNVPGRTVADLANETVAAAGRRARHRRHQGCDGGPRPRQRAHQGAQRGVGKREFAVYSGEDITALAAAC